MASMLQWMTTRQRAQDWFCWNALARVAMPVGGAAFALIAALETLSGGFSALSALFSRGIFLTMMAIAFFLVLITCLLFALQGSDVLECTMDGKGVRMRVYLPSPTPLRLILRGLSPSAAAGKSLEPMKTAEFFVSWKEIRRVQLWPEKGAILFYGPRFWLRVYLICTPETWKAALQETGQRLGRKKNVILPACLVQVPSAKSGQRSSSAAKSHQISYEEIRRMNAEAEKQDKLSQSSDQP